MPELDLLLHRLAVVGRPEDVVRVCTKPGSKTPIPFWGHGWGPAFGPPYGYGGAYDGSSSDVTEHVEGTMILDVVDGGTNRLVWRGTAQADLGENPSSEEAQKKVDEAAKKNLAKFPPKE
jgi:hypothetical protein